MMEITNTGSATTDAETEELGLRKYLGRYLRYFLMPLVALAFFGVLSVAAPKEALAAGTGWYWTAKSDGYSYECYWVYYGTDYYGNPVWTEDGCKYYWGTSLYYAKYSTGQTLMAWNGQWLDQTSYWNGSDSTGSFVIPGYTSSLGAYNTSNIDYFMAAARNAAASVWTNPYASLHSSSYRAADRATLDSEVAAPTGPQSPTVSGVPEPGSDGPKLGSQATDNLAALRTSEVSTMTDFPWKVCQDNNSKCMRYSGKAWKQVNTTKAKGGTYRVSSSKIKGAFFAATGATNAGGSTMEFITKTGPTMGKAWVLVVNLANAKVVKQVTFDLKTANNHYKVAKSITGLTPHMPYGLIVLSANGKPVAVDAVGYEAHGSMCHNVL